MHFNTRVLIHRHEHLYKLCLRAVNQANWLFFAAGEHRHHWREQLMSLKSSRTNGRCFIIGNGPSLSTADLEMLTAEDTFASNQIFRAFERTSWRPKYYVVQDIYGNIADEVDSIECEVALVGDYYMRKIGTVNPRAICYHAIKHVSGELGFSSDASRYVVDHATVTYTMIQIAVFLGYTEIYLIGMDHSYRDTISSGGVLGANAGIDNHFYEDSAAISVVANIEGMEQAYIAAQRYAKAHGVLIRNATHGGHLEVFERVSLSDALVRDPFES